MVRTTTLYRFDDGAGGIDWIGIQEHVNVVWHDLQRNQPPIIFLAQLKDDFLEPMSNVAYQDFFAPFRAKDKVVIEKRHTMRIASIFAWSLFHTFMESVYSYRIIDCRDIQVREVIRLYGTQQIKINGSELEREILVFICQQANSLVNCGTYLLRQSYFAYKRVEDNAFALHAELKDNPHFKILRSAAAQQVLTGVAESFTSYKALLEAWGQGKLKAEPRLPGYRTKGGLATVSYPARWVNFELDSSVVKLSLGNEFKSRFGIDYLEVPAPYRLKPEWICEVRLLPRNGCFYVEYVYEKPDPATDVDKNRVLGIDPGLNNWLTCISNVGASFIINGKEVKSFNRFYNKRVAEIKKGKDRDYWDDDLASLTEKRNRRNRDAINKAARMVLNKCLKLKIGTVVFGWNQGNKDGINIGKKNNQEFVQVPTARLKERLKQLCEEHGIRFIETEESYTSKASALDGDVLPKFGAKPEGWEPSGKRISRGRYRTATGIVINADCNGALNILRKVEAQLGLSGLVEACRAVLTLPTRLKIWHSKRKSGESRLQPDS